ncbi:hypothetical protein OAT66_00260 [Candidatus Marinimicrobia bacterium]|nr:hypothetical protein [Candidatus Neomarinimicrobiota bacterium]
MSKNHFVGLDCGASKILYQKASFNFDLDLVIPSGNSIERLYSNNKNWIESFEPVSIQTQLKQFSKNVIVITSEEESQGKVIIEEIKKLLALTDQNNLSICFPGLKSNEGVCVMKNGPRIPFLKKKLNLNQHIFNDSDCCTIGEWKSSIGCMINIKNAIYIGGGTGIADGIIMNGKILNFNDNSDLKRSWEMGFNDSTIESQISPGGMIKTLNTKFNKNIRNLDEFLESKESLTILKNASEALSSLIQSRTNLFRLNGLEPEIVVIGQRLGLFLNELKEEIQEMFYQSSKIPLKFSTDRRTAALGAIYKMIKY